MTKEVDFMLNMFLLLLMFIFIACTVCSFIMFTLDIFRYSSKFEKFKSIRELKGKPLIVHQFKVVDFFKNKFEMLFKK